MKPLTILTAAIIIIIIVHIMMMKMMITMMMMMMIMMMMMTMMMMIFPPTHRVTYLWLGYPPIMTMVSPASGIPHARDPEWRRSKLAPPVKKDSKIEFMLLIPGTLSAVSFAALLKPPSRTMESGREGGVQAV